jgi:hypothetical protein
MTTGEDLVESDPNSVVGTFFKYGLPGYLEMDISKSMAMDIVQPGTPTEVALNLISGPLVSIGQSFGKAYDQWERGAGVSRLAEELSPVAVRNILRSIREGFDGVTTRRGQEVYDPKTLEPIQLSAGEMALQSMGFKPKSTAMRQDVNDRVYTLEQKRQSKSDALASRFVNAHRRGDWGEMNAVLDSVMEWNERAVQNDIPPIDLKGAIENRMSPKLPKKPWWNLTSRLSSGG